MHASYSVASKPSKSEDSRLNVERARVSARGQRRNAPQPARIVSADALGKGHGHFEVVAHVHARQMPVLRIRHQLHAARRTLVQCSAHHGHNVLVHKVQKRLPARIFKRVGLRGVGVRLAAQQRQQASERCLRPRCQARTRSPRRRLCGCGNARQTRWRPARS